ncbi:SGNH/GDSL hydrolase family protein [Thalassomonas viridans]|uniref:SGNH/GDSL hydrolase family protein n=1 Tax=Thalassomonas viridans TaxID=137584 RepID=A0AAE9ZER2_9GAMM|nr:SGNH/GDSL hydrolase family protein [Thalassomonas viridans]WDE09143.1 SGNH/GDSL hydrolase family protein [Thalassomonas viridans]
MKRYLLTLLLLLPFHSFAGYEKLPANKIKALQSDDTYTYVRCWYRPSENHDNSATDWEWARNEDNSYYKIHGYWYSSVSWKNMFYTNTANADIMTRCEKTLGVNAKAADITFFAADNRFSFNHTIWTNDTSSNNDNQSKINKIVSIGDSISDTGNIYNASQWLFPNDDSWFLGHFSNGLVWTEYLGQAKNLPVYTWAIGGAEGEDRYGVLTGIGGQIDSYLEYMQLAKNYDPKDTLLTLEFGLNDFVNDDRTVAEVSDDFAEALQRLTASGIENMVILNLPDASRAPQFKYAEAGKAEEVRSKIAAFNAYIAEEVARYQAQGFNFGLYDTSTLFDKVIQAPQNYGLRNATDSCLDINRSSSVDYLLSHALRADCATYGSDTYLFWGVTHPTTKAHSVIAEEVVETLLPAFNF